MEQKFTPSASHLSARCVAEIQLSCQPKVKASLRPKISSSNDAYQILISSWEKSKIDFVEQFKVILLNRANKVLGVLEISSGGSPVR